MRQKVFPHPTVGVRSASNSTGAMIISYKTLIITPVPQPHAQLIFTKQLFTQSSESAQCELKQAHNLKRWDPISQITDSLIHSLTGLGAARRCYRI